MKLGILNNYKISCHTGLGFFSYPYMNGTVQAQLEGGQRLLCLEMIFVREEKPPFS